MLALVSHSLDSSTATGNSSLYIGLRQPSKRVYVHKVPTELRHRQVVDRHKLRHSVVLQPSIDLSMAAQWIFRDRRAANGCSDTVSFQFAVDFLGEALRLPPCRREHQRCTSTLDQLLQELHAARAERLGSGQRMQDSINVQEDHFGYRSMLAERMAATTFVIRLVRHSIRHSWRGCST